MNYFEDSSEYSSDSEESSSSSDVEFDDIGAFRQNDRRVRFSTPERY